MIATVHAPNKVWTEAELEALPDDGYSHEVVNGELVMSPKSNFQHERICTRLLPGTPDLAVEVLAPSNIRAEIDARLKDFFTSGAQIAWIINPQDECAEICHSLENRNLVASGGFLDGEHLLPGFRYPIADLFKEWDWE